MIDDTAERVEMKIAFLERTSQELSDVVYRQQQEIAALQAQLANLAGKLDALKSEPTAYTPEEERPPHY